MTKLKISNIFLFIIILAALIAVAYIARGYYYNAITIHKLLAENKYLKQAITNLTEEDQIGYAKVLSQQTADGKLITTIRFVETARDDKLKHILEKEYSIEGDIIHFDALIVRFGNKVVMDGKHKSIYLWRRVYGEKMPPESGFPIEQPGSEPQRYKDILALLPASQRELFWSSIWDLANNPEKLKDLDITAIYGSVLYTRLKPGLIYIFKISPTGQFSPEVVPDM